jgi:hypothetical protein
LGGDWVGPVVTATLISSFIAAIGWYVSWRSSNAIEGRRRAERIRDVQTALLAEIRSIVHHLQQYETTEIFARVSQQFETDDSYLPFISREAGSPLFGAVATEISILPNDVIDQVVLFYRQQEVIGFFADDLRSDRFAALPKLWKLAMIGDYLALKDFAAILGKDAVTSLEASLKLRPNRSAGVP